MHHHHSARQVVLGSGLQQALQSCCIGLSSGQTTTIFIRSAATAYKRLSQLASWTAGIPSEERGVRRVTGPSELSIQPLPQPLYAVCPDCIWPQSLREGLKGLGKTRGKLFHLYRGSLGGVLISAGMGADFPAWLLWGHSCFHHQPLARAL